tara:strand:- start:31016 stop:31723 length:708 start_codon:yes stop_codon:yes gene_type:complete
MDTFMTPHLASDSVLLKKIGVLSEELVRDLPNNEDQREQTIVERALQYAAESEQRIAAQRERIAELENLSSTEPLTKLPNRRVFENQFDRVIARARRYGETGVVEYCDLDNLKAVNDEFGHTAGDDLLRCAAQALKNSVREIDVIGRLGGDEFGVVLVNTSWKDGARRMRTIQWMLDSAGTVYRGKDISLEVSIGVEPYGPHDTVEDLIHRADMAMYYNKRRKQSGFQSTKSAAE